MPPATTAARAGAGPVESARFGARRRRGRVSAVVVALSILTSLALAIATGLGKVADRAADVRPAYLLVTVLAPLVAYAGYAAAHRRILAEAGTPRMRRVDVVRVVALGFGGWAIGGGFAVDRRELTREGVGPGRAGASVVTLAVFELVVLTLPAWLCALVLLDAPRVPASETVPWAVLVPVVFAAGLLVAVRSPPSRGARGDAADPTAGVDGLRRRWRELSTGLGAALRIVQRPREGAGAISGLVVYWGLDIVSLWGALRLFSAPSRCRGSCSPTPPGTC